ncbi:unnamed protein product [Moneuplotes crassus]|uniref:Uncharacterized protein n=1 Tax=Euplotes crassus TaxID=5936 RepID=A0AAD1Y4Z5_EUPCR|nr:unnamed protein product [Moneuplotes crassus]
MMTAFKSICLIGCELLLTDSKRHVNKKAAQEIALEKVKEKVQRIESVAQLTQCFENGTFVNVKNIEAKKLPTLEEEIYGYVDEDESEDSSDDEDGKSGHSQEFGTTNASRGFTGNLSEIAKADTKNSKAISEMVNDDGKEVAQNEEYKIDREYTQKQDITDCFMPLRKFLECNYGVCYREKAKEREETEEDKKRLADQKKEENRKKLQRDMRKKKGSNKKNKKKKEEKKEEPKEEEPNEFYMKGKPYKDKYDGIRLTKGDYQTKFSIASEKIKINFPGVAINEDGTLRKINEPPKRRKSTMKEVQGIFRSRKSILRIKQAGSQERKRTHFASDLDLVQSQEKGGKSAVKLPQIQKTQEITEHTPEAKRFLLHEVPVMKVKKIRVDTKERKKRLLESLSKTVHDKYNTAAVLDRNWGKSSKVATEFDKRVHRRVNFNKSKPKAGICFRKLNKTVVPSEKDSTPLSKTISLTNAKFTSKIWWLSLA